MKAIDAQRTIKKKIKNDTLYQEMQKALELMRNELSAMVNSAKPQMNSDLDTIINSGGKRLRPILAFVCYRMGGITETDILPLMCMLELMHTASLIHDDVVDGASMRRNCPTINSVRGNMAAAQSGDFLLAKAMGMLHAYRGTVINEMLAEVSYQMCLGELQQQGMRFNYGIQSKEAYFGLINKKTARFFAASCYCGAIAGGMSKKDALALYSYGEKLGIAFQLQDDLLDYADGLEAGKTAGQDLRNGIFTLPVLILLENGVPDSTLRLLKKREKTVAEIAMLTEFINNSGATKLTELTIKKYCQDATLTLEGLKSGPESVALNELAMTLAQR